MEKFLSSKLQIKNFKDFLFACNHFDIEINNNQLDLFKKYYEILLEWNKKINLISRKEEHILEKHFLDSILFLPEIESLTNKTSKILDIGSGGGFPAIPLAIMKPDWDFVLCESIKKKAGFLIYLVKELSINNVEIVNARIETLRATSPQQSFDLITARAVGKLDLLIKYSLPLLKPGGSLIAYKAKEIDEEIKKVTLPLQIFSKNLNDVERKLAVITLP